MVSRVVKSKVTTPSRDLKKESIFRDLASVLQGAGYVVRREKLKQGHGWKVVSGSCVSQGSNLIFVDRRMSQDDQISFLSAKISSLKVAVKQELLETLPESVTKQILAD